MTVRLEDDYTFIVYIEENDSSYKVLIEEPEGNDAYAIHMQELSWVEYDNIQRQCMIPVSNQAQTAWGSDIQNTLSINTEWKIDKMKMQRLLLKECILFIMLPNGTKIDKDILKVLPSDLADSLYQYYNTRCILSTDDINRLSSEVSAYLNPDNIQKIKPPYNKMIVIVDLLRHFGSFSIDDIMRLSKKDLDTMFIIARLGLHWSGSSTAGHRDIENDRQNQYVDQFDPDNHISEIEKAELIKKRSEAMDALQKGYIS